MAQLVAHLHGMQGVRGSSPLRSTDIDTFDSRGKSTFDGYFRFGNLVVLCQYSDKTLVCGSVYGSFSNKHRQAAIFGDLD